MSVVNIGAIRGVCQIFTYIAYEKKFFEKNGVKVRLHLEPTAWVSADRLLNGQYDFAIIPCSRVIKARAENKPLVIIAGSGYEEPALITRRKSEISSIKELEGKKLALPAEGGMKDITGMYLLEKYNLSNISTYRYPSGDSALLALLSGYVDATINVEPFATMTEEIGLGKVLARASEIFPKTPGCSLTTTADMLTRNEELVLKILKAYKNAEDFLRNNSEEAAEISSKYIGLPKGIIEKALKFNSPKLDISDNVSEMAEISKFMLKLGYIYNTPSDFYNFKLLREALSVT